MQSYQTNPEQPWYKSISISPPKYEIEPSNSTPTHDPITFMQTEKIGQAERLLHSAMKALITRVSLERAHNRSRDEDIQLVRNHLVEFSDEPFGQNQSRDSMRWSLEQNLMSLSREERGSQLMFWQDIERLSKEILGTMESAESVKRRNALIEPYVLQSRIP